MVQALLRVYAKFINFILARVKNCHWVVYCTYKYEHDLNSHKYFSEKTLFKVPYNFHGVKDVLSLAYFTGKQNHKELKFIYYMFTAYRFK